jgi:transmembrane sensor
MTKGSWPIVDRYLAGEATPAERELVERWLAESEDFRMFLAELHRSELDDELIRRAAADVRARLERGEAPVSGSRRRRDVPRHTVRPFPKRGLGALKAAAAIAVLLSGPLLVWRLAQSPDGRHAEATFGTVVAPVGRSPVSVALADGSQVILSPGSTLRYATAFGATHREVRLDGEAYFAVEHDARRPFVVRAGDLVAEDLGTEFVVRAYPEDRYGRVIVREGLVRIGGTTVAPGQLGRLDATGAPVVEAADTASWFAWTRGRLNLDGMLLRDALPKLSRWYDLEFRLAEPSLGSIELSGDFPEQLNDDALKKIAIFLGLTVTRKGRVVTFHAGPASPS